MVKGFSTGTESQHTICLVEALWVAVIGPVLEDGPMGNGRLLWDGKGLVQRMMLGLGNTYTDTSRVGWFSLSLSQFN